MTFDLDLEHTLDAGLPGDHRVQCKFGGDRVICLQEEAILVPAQKSQYHVTFDLEHTLDARWPGVHRVQVCGDPAISLGGEAICAKVYR